MSEASFGLLALYNITSTFPSTLFFGPLGQGVLRIFSVANDKNELGIFQHDYNALFKLGAIFTLGFGTIGAVVCWSFGHVNWSIALMIMATLNISNSYNSIGYGLHNAQRNRIMALGLETGDRLLQQMIAIGLLIWVSKDPLVVIGGYMIGSLIFSWINTQFAAPTLTNDSKQSISMSGEYRRQLLIYAWPFFIFGALQWVQLSSDRWTLELLSSTEMVGQYAVLNQIGFQSFSLLFGSISYFLFPILFNRAGSLTKSGQFENANRLNNYFLIFNILITVGVALFLWPLGEWVILFLSDEKYLKVAWLLPFMAIAGGLFNFGQSYANRFLLSMQTKLLMWPKMITAICSILINYYAIKIFGLIGLVGAIVLSQLIYLATLTIIWNTYSHIKINTNSHVTH